MKKWYWSAGIGICLLLAFFVGKPPAPYAPYVPPVEYQHAAAQYFEKNFVDMPDGWKWSFFTAPDGARLRTGRVEPKGRPKATLVYMPGYAAPLDVTARFLEGLRARGYRVIGIDARGQGHSTRMLAHNPEKPWISDFGHYAEDYAAFVKSDMVPHDVPLVVMGESMGGHITTRMLGDFAPDVDGAFLIAPAFKLNTAPLPRPIARLFVGGLSRFGAGRKYVPGESNWTPWQPDLEKENPCGKEIDIIHLKDTLYAGNIALRVGGATNRWLSEFMKSNDRINKKDYLSAIKTPISMVTSFDDVITSTGASEVACTDKLPNCSVRQLAVKHCITYASDDIMAQIYNEIDALYERIK